MRKLITFSVCLLSLTFLSFFGANAQSVFNFGSSKPSSEPGVATTPSGSNRVSVLSPDEFKKTVNVLDEQVKSQLKDQLNQQIAKKPPIPLQQATPVPSSSSGPMMVPPNTSTTTTVTAPSVPNVTQQTTQTRSPSAPSTTSTSIINKPSTPQQQIYTGFGPPNTTPTPSSPGQQQQQQGGWNIKY